MNPASWPPKPRSMPWTSWRTIYGLGGIRKPQKAHETPKPLTASEIVRRRAEVDDVSAFYRPKEPPKTNPQPSLRERIAKILGW